MKYNPLRIQNDLKQTHPIFQELIQQLQSKFKFKTVECVRTLERQTMLFKQGKSKTMDSNHIRRSACDIFPLPLGYKTPMSEFKAIHDYWDDIVTKYHKDGFIVTTEKRLGGDMGHIGCRIVEVKK